VESMTRTLVIGGSGFIGRSLLIALAEAGRSITSLDREAPSDLKKNNNVSYISGDYGDIDLIEGLLVLHDEVIHLAHATRPNTISTTTYSDLSQNLEPTVQLFELASKHSIHLMFVSSGGTVYGESKDLLISEDHPTNPISPYGLTKLTLEKYAYFYAVTRNLNVVIVRPGNPYGEGQFPFSGQGFVSTALALGISGGEVSIFGKEGAVRDYLYIQDLVVGMVTVLNNTKGFDIYNIGSSVGRSNLDVVDSINKLLLSKGLKALVVNYESERAFDVRSNVLNSNKLESLGWKCQVDFQDGLNRFYNWMYLEGML